MGQPEEEKEEPEPIEILSDIDDYQKTMESQWESARSSYQNKIDQILGDFLDQAKSNQAEEDDSKFLKPASSDRNESLFSQAENALRAIEKKARELTGKKSQPRLVKIDWAGDRSYSPKRGHYLAIAGLLGAALSGFYFSSVPTVSSLPYSHTSGVVVEKGKIHIVDWFRKTMYVHKQTRGLPLLSVEALPNDFLTGMAFSQEKIWSSNNITGQILEHPRTGDHPVENRVDGPGKSPTGLFFDGNDLWSLDDASKKIFRHRGNDIEEIKEEFQLPDIEMSALSMSGSRAWVLSKKSREIHVCRLGEPVKPTGDYDLDSFLKGAVPTGMFIEGSHIWITTENPVQLLRLSKRSVLSKPSN